MSMRVLLLVLLSSAGYGADTLAFSVSPSPSNLGQTVTLQVFCCGNGKVVFYDGPQIIGTAISANGTVKLKTSLLSSGVHSLRAYWDGGGTNAAQTSAVTVHQVNALPQTGQPAIQMTPRA